MFVLRLLWTLSLFLLISIHKTNGGIRLGNQEHNPPGFEAPVPDPVCGELPDSGSGHQFLHMWYFNTETTQCREMMYRGYDGALNLFATRRECERRCLRRYTTGAEEVGPKLKATVEHKHKTHKRKFFAERLDHLDEQHHQNKEHNDEGHNEGHAKGIIDDNKPPPHYEALTPTGATH